MSLTNFKILKKHITIWEEEGLISSYQKESLILHTEEKIKTIRKKIKVLFYF